MSTRAPVGELIEALAVRLGLPAFVDCCSDLLGGADRDAYVDELRELSGHGTRSDAFLDRTSWHDYWVRTWAARGLLHVWDDAGTAAVVAGLRDRHWRPAEMCRKVATRHEVAGTADGAAALADHELPRVRAQAVRALGVVGDTEHVSTVEAALDDADPAVSAQAERALAALRRRLDIPGA